MSAGHGTGALAPALRDLRPGSGHRFKCAGCDDD
jgi:hypothetical protein